MGRISFDAYDALKYGIPRIWRIYAAATCFWQGAEITNCGRSVTLLILRTRRGSIVPETHDFISAMCDNRQAR